MGWTYLGLSCLGRRCVDLYIIIRILDPMQDLYMVTVPIKDPADRKTRTEMDIPMILPHQLIDYLYATYCKLINTFAMNVL